MDFFFEWQKLDAKTQQPFAIALKNGDLFAFAGLWETWPDKANGQMLDSYTIVTTDMQAILDPKDCERWLAPAEPFQLPVDLLRPSPANRMTAGMVANDVGNVSSF